MCHFRVFPNPRVTEVSVLFYGWLATLKIYDKDRNCILYLFFVVLPLTAVNPRQEQLSQHRDPHARWQGDK